MPGVCHGLGTVLPSPCFYAMLIAQRCAKAMVYQIEMRSSTGKNIDLSPPLNASYHAAIWRQCSVYTPFAQECVNLRQLQDFRDGYHDIGVCQERNCSGVKPSFTGSGLAAVAFLNA